MTMSNCSIVNFRITSAKVIPSRTTKKKFKSGDRAGYRKGRAGLLMAHNFDLAVFARKYNLTAGQIAEAVGTSKDMARHWLGRNGSRPMPIEDFFKLIRAILPDKGDAIIDDYLKTKIFSY